jgi:hypothetical protein
MQTKQPAPIWRKKATEEITIYRAKAGFKTNPSQHTVQTRIKQWRYGTLELEDSVSDNNADKTTGTRMEKKATEEITNYRARAGFKTNPSQPTGQTWIKQRRYGTLELEDSVSDNNADKTAGTRMEKKSNPGNHCDSARTMTVAWTAQLDRPDLPNYRASRLITISTLFRSEDNLN